MRAWLTFLLFAAPLLGRGAIVDPALQSGAAGTYEDLRTTCQNLISGAEGSIDKLSQFYAPVTNAEIREAITAAIGLYWISRGRTVEADTYANHLKNTFTNSKYLFLLSRDAHVAVCEKCHGMGQTLGPCTECGGTGKCRGCGGKGTIARLVAGGTTLGGATLGGIGASERTLGRGKPVGSGTINRGLDAHGKTLQPIGETAATRDTCPTCAGSGKCRVCKGAREVKGKCPICHGEGTFVTPNARIAYLDVLNHLAGLANAVAMRERGMILVEGRWLDRFSYTRRTRQRREERDYFTRVTEEAERAKDYETAAKLLDKAVARYPDSTYTGDVMRVKAIIQADAFNTTPKDVLGPEQATAAAEIALKDIPETINIVLEAARRETNAPLFCLKGTNPVLPVKPMKWTIGTPELLDRSARVSVTIERASRSDFAITEPWVFMMLYDSVDWKLWQTIAP